MDTDQGPAAPPPRVELPDEQQREAARDRHLRLTKPAGALGRLEELGAWASAVQGRCPPQPFTRPRLIIFAGDHGISSMTSAYPPEVTAQMVRNLLTGGAAANALAARAGVGLRVIDVSVDADPSYADDLATDVGLDRIRRGTHPIDVQDAMTSAEAAAAVDLGRRVADEEVDAGADLLIAGDMGIGNTTPAAAIVGLLTGNDAAKVTGHGTGVDDNRWMRKCAAVRDAMRRGRPLMGDWLSLLAAISGPDLAATTGFLLQASIRRTPIILDGVVSTACALVADRMDFRAKAWWLAGHRSTEPTASLALTRLGMEPVVDFGMRLGEGTGALIALPIVQSSIAVLADMATFDEAGVSDRP
ncbi:MAG: nicotinate-nucleotide--dimethylbenzimidazole phosphoribosyltransferase [Actinomycetales bacterium]